MIISVFKIILLSLWCVLLIATQAVFVLLALLMAGSVALIVSAASFTARGHFVTQIEWMAMEGRLLQLVDFLDSVPKKILGMKSWV
jgi:hypothetical protein